jgi:hypothetical protein
LESRIVFILYLSTSVDHSSLLFHYVLEGELWLSHLDAHDSLVREIRIGNQLKLTVCSEVELKLTLDERGVCCRLASDHEGSSDVKSQEKETFNRLFKSIRKRELTYLLSIKEWAVLYHRLISTWPPKSSEMPPKSDR